MTNKVKIYDSMPEGWQVIQGATTAPNGYVWINNGKGYFSDDYQHALLRMQG